MSHLTTGIDSLDRQLGGGFTSGSLVALKTPPDAPSSALLHQLMKERPTTYITTLRPRSAIETELANLPTSDMDVTIEVVGNAKEGNNMLHTLTESSIYAANTNDRERILDEVHEIVDPTDEGQNVIIDPMNPLERSESRTAYQRLLQAIGATLRDVGGLGICHCMSSDNPPRLRQTTLTMADTVWDLEVVPGDKDDLTLMTSIPKNRGGNLVFEKVTLLLDKNDVYTDRSRAI